MTFFNETTIYASSIVFLILDPLFIIARFYFRWRTKSIGIDDWLCIPAMIFGAGMQVLMIIGAAWGVLASFLSADGTMSLKGAYAWQSGMFDVCFTLVEPMALASIKLSLLFFYRRLFIDQVVHYIIWILVGIVVAWSLAMPIVYMIFCSNRIRTHFQSDCYYSIDSRHSMEKAYTTVDTAIDFAILIIPVPLIVPMLVPWRRKLAILCPLLVGSLAIAFAVLRMIVIYEVFGPLDPVLIQWLPSCAIGIGQIAICLPMLGPGILRHFHRVLVRIWDSKIRNQEPAPQCVGELGPISNAAKKGQEDTLGSVNTQNLEAYAMGRIHADKERGMTVSSVSKDISIETGTARSSY
ncbi:hypothetical protein PHISCL_06139 [Aspergillus sclerotialis]|uniref:Rhodopsin domain-containing protein n=1 Tax=Aspergillus sclerotialis TaxID=2070753 RepID=A0A3A2ZU67_9EURO|nr:hypothetical protein PHISCL_06139 [Aspergillus sclerotialis]